MHSDTVVIAASYCIQNPVHSYVLLCICSALHSTRVAFKCICMPPHISCILSTRCILTHSHSHAFTRIQMHSFMLIHTTRKQQSREGHAFTHAFVCIHTCMHSCAFRCIFRIRMHMYAFVCILVHSDAYDASIFPWKCGKIDIRLQSAVCTIHAS